MTEIALVNVVAGEILKKVISLVTEQISLAWGFKDELTRLRNSLTTIQAVLADAERRQVREEFVRLWLQRLKDIAYDVDDVLDELAYENLRRKVEIQNQMKRKIFRCPKLRDRCAKGCGAEWSKIAHIPEFFIDKAE